MLAKTKARIEKFEETHENVRDVHTHLVRYQLVYGMAASSVVTALLMKNLGGGPSSIVNTNTVSPNIAPVIHVAPVMSQIVHNGGRMRKIIRCLETDQMWPSMTAAAAATGNNLTMMSRHCNGHLDELQGLHFVIEALATG